MLIFHYIHARLPSHQQTLGWLRELHRGEHLYIFPIENYNGKSDRLFPGTATMLSSWDQELLVGFKPSEIPVLDGWQAHTGPRTWPSVALSLSFTEHSEHTKMGTVGVPYIS